MLNFKNEKQNFNLTFNKMYQKTIHVGMVKDNLCVLLHVKCLYHL